MYIFDIVPARMRLERGYAWRVVCISDHPDEAKSSVVKYLTGLRNGSKPDELDALMRLFQECCERGPEGLPSKTRHHLDQANQIYEFRKGRHRIAWFYDEGKIVVCTHCFFKSTTKAPKEDRNKAIKFKKAYFAAKNTGKLNGL